MHAHLGVHPRGGGCGVAGNGRARDVASRGAGVAVLLAHVTSVIGSPTHLAESGKSIKRSPNQVSVRFRKVGADAGYTTSAIYPVAWIYSA